MFARIKKTIYLCTAFERKRFYNNFGSLGEWLKPPVC